MRNICRSRENWIRPAFVACRESKSQLLTWLTRKSSGKSFGGLRNACNVSYIVGYCFFNDDADFVLLRRHKLINIKPTLNITEGPEIEENRRICFIERKKNGKRWLPSHKNMSHTRNRAGHGRVLVKTHKNHSVMYNIGSIFCFFCRITDNYHNNVPNWSSILRNCQLTRCLWMCGKNFFKNANNISPSICKVS